MYTCNKRRCHRWTFQGTHGYSLKAFKPWTCKATECSIYIYTSQKHGQKVLNQLYIEKHEKLQKHQQPTARQIDTNRGYLVVHLFECWDLPLKSREKMWNLCSLSGCNLPRKRLFWKRLEVASDLNWRSTYILGLSKCPFCRSWCETKHLQLWKLMERKNVQRSSGQTLNHTQNVGQWCFCN